jgi:sec-independent protein translocase protein TatB
MEIFGVGAPELIFIILIAIIVLGPKDMQKAGKTIGRWLNQFVRSDGWKALQRASKEIRNLPTNLMREANIEELQKIDRDIRNSIDPRQPPASSPGPSVPPSSPAVTLPQPSTDNPHTEDQK